MPEDELTTTPEHDSAAPMRREPADLREVDLAVVELELTRMMGTADKLLGQDRKDIRSLVLEAAKDIKSGIAADTGVQLDSLGSRVYLTASALRSRFGRDWEMYGDLVVRLGIALNRRRVHVEQVNSLPVKVNRDQHGLGTDHIRQATSSMRFITIGSTTADRTTITNSRPYTVGTRDSAVDGRADPLRIASFDAELRVEKPANPDEAPIGRLVPATLDEHLREFFDARAALLAQLREAGEQGYARPDVIERVERICFPAELVLHELPYGPAQTRSSLYQDVALAGDDEAVFATLAREGRRAVARCGSVTTARAEEAFRRHELKAVNGPWSDLATAMGLNLAPWGMSWHWWPAEELLLCRRMVGARVQTFTAFRTVNLADDVPAGVALACLEQEPWPRECARRAAAENAWGKISASSIRTHAGLRTVLHIADAALIAAERRRDPRR